MRYLILALTLAVGASSASAGDDIKSYVEYQTQRSTRTYEDAVEYHKQTKKPVIVWVAVTDSDENYKIWLATKDDGYHVFVKEFTNVYSGIVVGRDANGSFVQFASFSPSAEKIKESCTVKFQPAPTIQTVPGNCPGGRCPVPSSYSYTLPSSNCPNGRCPTPR